MLLGFLRLGLNPADVLERALQADDHKCLRVLAIVCAERNDSKLNAILAKILRDLVGVCQADEYTDVMKALIEVPSSPPPLFLADQSLSRLKESILTLAVLKGNLGAVEGLLAHQCVQDEVDAVDEWDCTALHRACQSTGLARKSNNGDSIINKLLDAGAFPEKREPKGERPGHFVRFPRALSDSTRKRLLIKDERARACPQEMSNKRKAAAIGPSEEVSPKRDKVMAPANSDLRKSCRAKKEMDYLSLSRGT